MKKYMLAYLVLILIGLAGLALSATKTPLITYDPNSVIESPTDPNNVTVAIQIEITKEQYDAMQYLGVSFVDVVDRRRLSRRLNRLIVQAKAKMTEPMDVNDLKTKLGE